MSSADEKDSLLLITFSCTRCMVDWMMESFVNGPCSTDDIDWWCTSSCVNPHKFVHASLTAIIVCGLETVVTIHAWFDTSTSCNVRIGMCEKSLMVCDASRCWYSFGSIDCIYARSLSSGAAKDNELYNHVDDDVGALFTSWWTTAAVTAAVVLYPCRCAGRAARRNTADDDLMTNLDVDANMVINDIFLCEDEFFSFYSYYSYNCVVRFNENENCLKRKRVTRPSSTDFDVCTKIHAEAKNMMWCFPIQGVNECLTGTNNRLTSRMTMSNVKPRTAANQMTFDIFISTIGSPVEQPFTWNTLPLRWAKS